MEGSSGTKRGKASSTDLMWVRAPEERCFQVQNL